MERDFGPKEEPIDFVRAVAVLRQRQLVNALYEWAKAAGLSSRFRPHFIIKALEVINSVDAPTKEPPTRL